MFKKSISICLFLLLNIAFIYCQNQTVCNDKNQSVEVEQITQMINTYFEGWMTGDTTKLSYAMHRTCQLKNIKDDDVIIFDRSTYLGFLNLENEEKMQEVELFPLM